MVDIELGIQMSEKISINDKSFCLDVLKNIHQCVAAFRNVM